MPTVADVVRRYGEQYLERFGATMPGEHKKVLHAISACRTGELGTVLYACQSCGTMHMVGRSCGNRHCPTCQHDKTQAWLEKQTDRLLPCPYFLVTFTLPAELRELARSHQRVVYSALFEASSAALRLGGRPQVRRHRSPRLLRCPAHLGPHAGVPPARALRRPGGRDRRGRQSLAPLARRLPGAGEGVVHPVPRQVPRHPGAEGLLPLVDPAAWRRDWVVNSQAVGDGRPRCATWPLTSSGWQSATIGSSPAMTAKSPSPTVASDRTGRAR